MAKDRRSKMALLKERFQCEYDAISLEIKKLEGQRDALQQSVNLIDIINKEKRGEVDQH